jgi:hypothetical protein
MGAEAHSKITEYITQLNEGTSFIEIGSGHHSTRELSEIAIKHNFIFYSIDINGNRNTNDYKIINDTGENFLRDYNKWIYPHDYKISFAYLDNYDWMWTPKEYYETQTPLIQHEQYMEYQKAGLVLSNINSQKSHLEQTILMEKLTDDKCMILYDDTWYDENQDIYIGKGGACIIYLLTKGWSILPITRHDLNQWGHMAILIGKNIIPNKEGTIH